MKTLAQDLRYGFRFFRNSPGFTAVAVLTLALGIACTSTVASWADGLLRGYPGVSDAGRIVAMETVSSTAKWGTPISWPDYRDYRDNLKSISGLVVRAPIVFTVGDANDGQPVWGELVSGNFFSVLGIKPMLGRTFTEEEAGDKPGAYPVAVIGYRLWHSRYHENPAIVGKTIRVNRHDLTIVGVTGPDFLGSQNAIIQDLWIPATMGAELGLASKEIFNQRAQRAFYTLARLAPGASVEQASAEAATFAHTLETANPKTNFRVSATMLPLWRQHDGPTEMLRGPLFLLMAVSLLVLLIACANVANLLLARSVSRNKEFGIRIALGAGRVRLARQLLTETLILAAAGTFVGFPLCLWMQESLSALIPSVGLPVVTSFGFNGRVVALTIATCVVAALFSGAAPALFSLRGDVNSTLKEGGRSGSTGAASNRTRRTFVIAEVALAAVALIGACLFLRSFQNVRTINTGMERAHVLYGRFFIESASYTPDDSMRFCSTLQQRLESVTGIESVGYSDFTPLSSPAGPWWSVEVDGYTPTHGENMAINRSLISPNYFRSLGIPILEGREFRENDDRNAPPVMIVNESFARRFFHGESPVGRRVQRNGKWISIVGLARDSKYFTPVEQPQPFMYAPFRQFYTSSSEMGFFVKTPGDPLRAVRTLRREVASVDPRALAFHPVPYIDYSEVAILTQKIAAMLLAGLALISLVLAAVGIYSVMSFSVSQRTQEIGVRMAMGAKPANVIGMVVRQGMVLALAGLLAGVATAFVVTRLAASMLVNVTSADPLSYAAGVAFLTCFAALAAYVPARRATRIDPITALRSE